jgi:hypothetical protein
MLASTVQFSSNDQPPVTPTPKGKASPGSALKTTANGRALRTQQRARHPTPPNSFHASEEAVLEMSQAQVPNSQRSTHELTTAGRVPA